MPYESYSVDVSASTLRSTSGTPLTVAATSEGVLMAETPDMIAGHKIPLTDEAGHIYEAVLPPRLSESEMTPAVGLVLLFENALVPSPAPEPVVGPVIGSTDADSATVGEYFIIG